MEIHILNEETVSRIAAGEVIERPVNVVKELVENSIDAGAGAITVEITDGGRTMIRVTDNGCGIERDQIPKAFLRHATSKIQDENDLTSLHTLGFRGEALASITSVARVEMITKTVTSISGIRITNQTMAGFDPEKQIPLEMEEIGAPDGTTVFVRDLFYNVPVRRKFLKQPQTEAGYITDLISQQALSHPDISFHYRVNRQERLHTSGNGDLKELIYRIYGREISSRIIPVNTTDESFCLEGFIGRPEISRSSRNAEIFFINGRMLKDNVLSRGLEAGFGTDLMQHRFPFAVLHLHIPGDILDVNVHPSKMEVRFADPKAIYDFMESSVHEALHQVELIPREHLMSVREEKAAAAEETRKQARETQLMEHTEPFEGMRRDMHTDRTGVRSVSPADPVPSSTASAASFAAQGEVRDSRSSYEAPLPFIDKRGSAGRIAENAENQPAETPSAEEDVVRQGKGTFEQMDLSGMFSGTDFSYSTEDRRGDEKIFTEKNVRNIKLIGQIFRTYWIVEYDDKMLMIDQHAAHEKVNFERLMARLDAKQGKPSASQMVSPACILVLTGREEALYEEYSSYFHRMGYEIDDLGQGSYAIRGVPTELYGSQPDELIHDILAELEGQKLSGTPHSILYKIATMACKASVKGNMRVNEREARELIRELLSLDNPYHCPHGRPTMIELSKYEIERKFGRIV